MKLLIIDEEFPYPLNTGKRMRSFHLARILSQEHEVSYLAYGQNNSPDYSFFLENGLKPYPVEPPNRRQSGPRFYLRLLSNLRSKYPYIVTSHYSDKFDRRLKELVLSEKIDCIICEWTPYAIFLRDIVRPKKIIVAHNIEAAIWRGYLDNERNPIKRFYIRNQARKVAEFERQCFSWGDGATAVCDGDAGKIASFQSSCTVEVIENGVDTAYFSPRKTPIDRNMLVFTGSMDWRPNQDAALYFTRRIFPYLKKVRPQISICFVGRNPSHKIISLGRIAGITVTGTVDDVRPYIAKAALFVVPLRIGGGSRLKILEAMSMQKAVISTTIGAEGLRVKDNENIVLADDPVDFAAKIVGLLDDDKRRQFLAMNAANMVGEYYRWETLGKRLSEFICRIVNQA